MSKELVERLRIVANMINTGEKIRWGEETALMDAAADLIERQSDLMTKAHAVMRACGWQLAIGAEPQSDGVLEAACTEIEAEFAEHLAPEEGK